MALYKEITHDNGISTNYTRILYMTITPNEQNSIAVKSYINGNFRLLEKDGQIPNPYSVANTYETSYDPEMTIESAYNYLKTLPEFEGSEDV